MVTSFVNNGINVGEICSDVLSSLSVGRSETTPALVLAGRIGGEGKSFFLKTLAEVFSGDGEVFSIPGKSNFPLIDLPKAKVAFLDDFRFNPDIVSWSTLMLWFDGSPVPISRPQNVQGVTGNFNYKGRAPVFITTKLSDIKLLEEQAKINPATGHPWNTDASMLLRRMKVYSFTTRISRPPRISCCARCFSQLFVAQASARTDSMA